MTPGDSANFRLQPNEGPGVVAQLTLPSRIKRFSSRRMLHYPTAPLVITHRLRYYLPVKCIDDLTWRCCLGPMRPQEHWTYRSFVISHSESNVMVVSPRIARFLDVFFQVTGLMNYGYGIVILSGMMLVNPYFALRTFILLGFLALIAKHVALSVLDIYPDVYHEVNVIK